MHPPRLNLVRLVLGPRCANESLMADGHGRSLDPGRVILPAHCHDIPNMNEADMVIVDEKLQDHHLGSLWRIHFTRNRVA